VLAQLTRQGVGPDRLVGAGVGPAALVVQMLGILPASGACLPLDPEAPDARIAALVAAARDDLFGRTLYLGDDLVELAGRAGEPIRTCAGCDCCGIRQPAATGRTSLSPWCGTSASAAGRAPCVTPDHQSGQVRGR
jgi:hypothetical protein